MMIQPAILVGVPDQVEGDQQARRSPSTNDLRRKTIQGGAEGPRRCAAE